MKITHTAPMDTTTTVVGTFDESTLSRRSFLYSLGALLLSGCGAGSMPSAADTSSKRMMQAAVVTGGSIVHPGLLHASDDFDRMKAKVAASASPWLAGWDMLIKNSHASLTAPINAQAFVSRGNDGVHPDNSGALFNDVATAYACALRWKVSGDTAYADKAVQVMIAWSSTLTGIGGTNGQNGNYDGILMAGIQGYEFANAGEIMRGYPGWAANDFARFQNMMSSLFYPVNHGALPSALVVYSSWDLCCVASILAIGVLCDDQSKIDEAISYFKGGSGNGCIHQAIYYVHPGHLGQTQESGRDQGHNTLSISLMAAICEMAWNQGIDLYGYDNNRFLAGAEYVAKGNLIQSGSSYYTVPFAKYKNANTTDTVFSNIGQGSIRPCWALIYNHYVNRRGMAAPYSKQFALQIAPEGGGGNYGASSGGFDQLGYGTLTCSRDPYAGDSAPSGLTARLVAGSVVLSWWGTANASSYNVKRAPSASGPFAQIATGVSDLLSFTDSGMADGTYYYVVTAITPSGESAPSNTAQAITAKQLHTHLAFDEGSGTNAGDSSGNGHTATLLGAAAWGTGILGGALSLNGSVGTYATLPAGFASGLSDFTIALRVWCNSNQTWARIFDFGSGPVRYMFLTPRSSGGVVRFAVTANGGHADQVINGSAALPAGQWVHVAVTLSGTVGTLYVNGVAVGSNPEILCAPFRLGETTQNYLGRSQFADPNFNGKIDDFRIYHGALSGAEIATLANS